MKYIRTTTPTEIYSLKPVFIVDRTSITCFKTHGNKGRYVNGTLETEENLEKWLKYNKTSILKEADTIEELCDEFVMDMPSDSNKPITTKLSLEKMKHYKKYEDVNFYGAIWTDKGLIYVAKMNEEGVLCLI